MSKNEVDLNHNIVLIKEKLENRKDFLSTDEYTKALFNLEKKRCNVMNAACEDMLYSSFLLGKTLTEISSNHDIPLEVVVFTALHYNWWNKKSIEEKESDIDGIETISTNIAENCLMIISNVVKKKVQVLSGGAIPTLDDVEIVSIAMKEMKNITGWIGSMRAKQEFIAASGQSKPLVQISNQTLNMNTNPTKTEVIEADKKLLPPTPEERIKELEEIGKNS